MLKDSPLQWPVGVSSRVTKRGGAAHAINVLPEFDRLG
jgi:hypothetical protein